MKTADIGFVGVSLIIFGLFNWHTPLKLVAGVGLGMVVGSFIYFVLEKRLK